MSTTRLNQRLIEDVVIFASGEAGATGAQALAPDHSPRQAVEAAAPPPASAIPAGDSVQRQVEQFLFQQSECLDGKHWQAFIDLFADDGVYWMPATPTQTEWLDSPSIFAEDKLLMRVRMGRITHPNAWSQAPAWSTSHLVGNVVVESITPTEITVRSRFHMLELRRDTTRAIAGTYRHTLRRIDDDFRIALQRVDIINAQAPWDYVLQAWV